MTERKEGTAVNNVRRIILLGKTGNGKSSTGNSILGFPGFAQRKSLCSVTESCEVLNSITRNNWPHYKVCDTPGLLDTDVSLVDRVLGIQRSVTLCSNPHAFLLVFSSASRMTEDEKYTIDILRIMFGEKVFEHCIVVFTRGDDFKRDADFKEFWGESPVLVELLKKCGNRVARIENQSSDDSKNKSNGIHRLLSFIEEVSSDGQRVYKYMWLRTHTLALTKHRQNYKGDDHIGSQLTAISESLGRNLKITQWTTALIVTTLGLTGVGGVGLAGYGAYAVGAATLNALPAIGTSVGGFAGGAVGGYVGAFMMRAAGGVVRNLKFW